MTATTTTQMKGMASSPCGCGSSGPAVPCGCGGAGCASCQGQIYVRPQFFAGQLLTDDDLRSLEDYVVAKNRLHARYLFGAGVVCGLKITCAPCTPGQVVVNAGYALDCCGNDIVVPCPQTLDVNSMVRELARSQRGQDCGDPCANGAAAGNSTAATVTNAQTMTPGAPNGSSGAKGTQAIARRYCLYVNYCEQTTDPVAPYASGDPCGQASCEPTRCQEGFRFSLRCPAPEDDCGAICSTFWGCIGDATAAERAIYESDFMGRYGSRLGHAVRRAQESPPSLAPDYWEELERKSAELSAVLLGEHAFGTEAAVRRTLGTAAELGSLVARFWVHATKLPVSEERRVEALAAADRMLQEIVQAIPKVVHERILTTTLERAHAEALGEVLEALHHESLRQRGVAAERRGHTFEPIKDLRVRYLAFGAVFARPMYVSAVDSLDALRTWLVDHLETAGTTRCALLKEVCAAIQPPAEWTGASAGDTLALATAAEVLSCAVREVLRDCFCNALLPPCATCDDPGVLLACVTVKDCAVTEICNLDRQFVLTGPTLRYWIPELCRLGVALEKWCCESRCERPKSYEQRGGAPRDIAALIGTLFAGAPPTVRLAAAAIIEGCPPPRTESTPAPERPVGMLAALSGVRAAGEGATSAVEEMKAEFQGTIEALRAEISVLRGEQAAMRERMGRRPGGAREEKEGR